MEADVTVHEYLLTVSTYKRLQKNRTHSCIKIVIVIQEVDIITFHSRMCARSTILLLLLLLLEVPHSVIIRFPSLQLRFHSQLLSVNRFRSVLPQARCPKRSWNTLLVTPHDVYGQHQRCERLLTSL